MMNRLTRALLLVAVASAAFAGETPPTQPAAPLLTIEAIEARIKTLEAATDVAKDEREAALKLYRDAVVRLQAQPQHVAKTQEFEALHQGSPALLQTMEARRTELTAVPEPTVPNDATLETLQVALEKARADLKAGGEHLAKLKAEAIERQGRRKKLPDLIRAAKDLLRQHEQRQAILPLPQDPPQVVPARATLVQAEIAATKEEVRWLEAELASYEERDKLLPLRIEVAGIEERQAKQRVAVLQVQVDDLRRNEAERLRREAEADVRRASHPAARAVAEAVLELRRRRAGTEGLVAKAEAVAQQMHNVEGQLATVQANYQRVIKRMEIAGMTNVLGVLLRKHRADLPSVTHLRQAISGRQALMAEAELQTMELRESRGKLLSVDEEARNRVSRIFPPVDDDEKSSLEPEIRELLVKHREALQSLSDDTNTYFTGLADLDSLERQLIAETTSFAKFIDEHVLWIRSAASLHWRDIGRAATAVRWLLSPMQWTAVVQALAGEAAGVPVLYLVMALLIAAVLSSRRKLVRRLDELAEAVRDYRNDTFAYTVRALGCTAAVALPLPLVLWVLGWNLASARVVAELPKALGGALWQAGWVVFPLGLFRQVCRPRGLGQMHFRWRGQTVDAARRAIGWWLSVVLPLLTLVLLIERQSVEAHKGSVGRLAFLAAMILTSVLFYRLMRVRGPLFAEAVTRADRRLLIRTRSLWFPVLVSAPVLIAAAAAVGYLFTAAHLFSGLLASFLLVLGLILARALILRWLSIQRRRVALRHMEGEGALATQGGPDAADQIQVTAVEHLVSLMEVREQTLSVLAWATGISGVLGLYLIWVDVLPALGILNEVALWGQAPPAGGGIVSLADLLLAIGALVLASTVGVNLPGLLEVTFLHWFAVAPGTRYAVTTMARYAVSAVAVVVVAALLGLRWASIQWLVAALTVGLGFGLQEIFANFVSGLIILFERPIRLGDTVTIGDISGTVSRIRIRATTITDWDRKELIVPNREFITGRLVNWTLSDSIIRIRVNMGIAYGSDVAKATECLLGAAKASADILKGPAPEALFLGFGNSSLDFELRVYVQGFEHYFSAINDLHRRIDAAFRASGVEIAFPQQDLHIRSVKAPFTVTAEPVKAPVALPPAPEPPPASPEQQPGG